MLYAVDGVHYSDERMSDDDYDDDTTEKNE